MSVMMKPGLINLEEQLKIIDDAIGDTTTISDGVGMDQIGFVVYEKLYIDTDKMKATYKDNKSLSNYFTTKQQTFGALRERTLDSVETLFGLGENQHVEGYLIELKEKYKENGDKFQGLNTFSDLKGLNKDITNYADGTIRLDQDKVDNLQLLLTEFYAEEDDYVEAKDAYYNARGRLVGIYKSNGEAENGVNKNLISMAYIPTFELNIGDVILSNTLNKMLDNTFSEFISVDSKDLISSHDLQLFSVRQHMETSNQKLNY